MGRMRLILALLLIGSLAHAQQADPDPDVELAARYFKSGAESYQQGDYGRALASFEMARRLKPIAALDYNIARCNDRLERYAEAIEAYERFLVASPGSSDADDVRTRIATLRERLPVGLLERPATPSTSPTPLPSPEEPVVETNPPPTPSAPGIVTPPAPPPERRPSRTGPVVVGALAGTAAIVGAGLLGSISPAYDQLERRWQTQQTNALQSDAKQLETRAAIGYATIGVAGALVIVDVTWWILRARAREPRRVSAVPRLGGTL